MPQPQVPKRADAGRSIDQQIFALELELERVINLPSTSPELRASLTERLAALKERAANAARFKGS